MARPIDNEKRRALAWEAVDVLRREGVELSMSRLAKSLGIKRPTLLYYFPTRAAIVETALEGLLTEQAVYVIGRMAKREHPLEQLHEQMRSVHAFHEGREERIVFLTQALATSGEERMSAAIEIGNRVFDAERKAMVQKLRAAMKAGRMKTCDPEALVRLIRSVIDGMMVQRVMTGCSFRPVHRLVWKQLLEPLMSEP